MLNSMVCRYADFLQGWYKAKEADLKIRDIYRGHSATEVDFVGRKFWEWCAIAQALEERDMLEPGRSGLGFAVGTEPLSSYFASKGCRILATDLDTGKSNAGWIERNEHAASLDAIYHPQLVDRRQFDRLVDFQFADMRTLQGLSGNYDFIWSSCALEHLGSLRAGENFVLNASRLLKPGGVAVHTTEFNVRSNTSTIVRGENVIYRQRDILSLSKSLQKRGMKLVPPNFDSGDHRFDLDVDKPPYFVSGKPHIKLEIAGHVSTSCLLIIEKQSREALHGRSLFENVRRFASSLTAPRSSR